MLTQTPPVLAGFTRKDATRLGVASGILVLVMTAILAVDLLPSETLEVQAGQLAPRDIVAPRAIDLESEVLTEEARAAAREAVPPQYDFTTDKAIAIAAEQSAAFDDRVERIDTAFEADITTDERASLLETAVAGPKHPGRKFDSSCFSGEYVTGVAPGYFDRIKQLRSDDAKRKRM